MCGARSEGCVYEALDVMQGCAIEDPDCEKRDRSRGKGYGGEWQRRPESVGDGCRREDRFEREGRWRCAMVHGPTHSAGSIIAPGVGGQRLVVPAMRPSELHAPAGMCPVPRCMGGGDRTGRLGDDGPAEEAG